MALVHAGALAGIEAVYVAVHTEPSDGRHIEGGIAAARARIRVKPALANSGLRYPPVRLSVAEEVDDRSLDLPMAVAIVALGRPTIPALQHTLLFGGLDRDGRLETCRGLIPQLRMARRRGLRAAVVPKEQLQEGAFVDGIEVFGADSLVQVLAFLTGEISLPVARSSGTPAAAPKELLPIEVPEHVRRAFEVAVKGRHHLLLTRAVGGHAALFARWLRAHVMGLPDEAEAREIVTAYSAAGLDVSLPVQRPLRVPHRTVSPQALLGTRERPGEVTLASHGVLLLDDLPRFQPLAVQGLRAVMRERCVRVADSDGEISMPAHGLVVGTMARCPCGRADGCSCSAEQIAEHRARVPREAFELHVDVDEVLEPAGPAWRLARTIASMAGRRAPVAADFVEASRYQPR